MTDSAIPPLELPDAPYPGAEPFRLIDHPIFFERNDETRLLLQQIIVYRGVLLYGDSGAGKSSLINAGLIPTVRKEGFVPDRIRLKNLRDREIIIERISLREDGKPPFLTPSLAGESGDTDRVVLSINDFRTRLFDFAREHYPLLIFDQFEEFATLFEQTQKAEDSRENLRIQAEILKLLVELLRHRELKVKMLFSFREDYLAKLTQLFTLSPELQRQYIRLIPPTTEKLHEIIAGPFKNDELRAHFISRSPSKAVFSAELIDGLEKDFRGRSTTGVLNLTEVQLACQKLWSSPTPDDLYAKENVSGLLRLVLEDAVAKLAEQKLREPGVALLSFMVTSFGTRNVISEFDLMDQVRRAGDFEDEALKRALDLLVTDSKLVRKVVLREAPHYEIVSEFFAPWIAERRREREKIKAEKEQQVSERALRLKKLTSRLAAVAAVTFLIFTVVSLLGQYKRGEVEDASKQLVKIAQREAELSQQTRRMQDLSQSLEQQTKISKEKMEEAEAQRRVAEAQLRQVEFRASLRVSEVNKRRLQQLQNEVNNLRSENNDLQTTIDERDEQIKTLTERPPVANAPQSTPTPVIIRTRPSAAADKPVRRSNMLFGSTMLEVALALILIYVLIGVVCAGVIGLIEAFTRQRSRFAWYGVMTLFDGDPDFGRQLASHPLIRPLGARTGRWPTGIPARSFALALTDVVAPSYASQPKPLVYFYDKIAALPNEYLRRGLLSLSSEAQTTSDMLTEMGNLYDSTMERVVTAYRWRVYLRILIAAFLLSLALNADTINIANSIPRYVDLRATVLSAATFEAQPGPTFSPTPLPAATSVDSTNLREVRKELNTLYLPIGWSGNSEDPRALPSSYSTWIFKIFGILITTLVASIIVQCLILVWGLMENRSRAGIRNRALVL